DLHPLAVQDRKIVLHKVLGLLDDQHVRFEDRHASDYAISTWPPQANRDRLTSRGSLRVSQGCRGPPWIAGTARRASDPVPAGRPLPAPAARHPSTPGSPAS